MRVVVFFLVCVGFLLLGGNDHIYAGTHYVPIQHIEKAQQVKFSNTHQNFAVIKAVGLHDEVEYLISDDVEDEDSNYVVARKCRLLVKPYLTLAYPWSANTLCNSCKDHLYFCGHLSNRYIVQRVLRI